MRSRTFPTLVLGLATSVAGVSMPSPAGAGPTRGGLVAAGNWVLDSPTGAVGRFGTAIAAGDWNGDGRKDLAVGAPTESSGGKVYFYFGTAAGLTLVDTFGYGSPASAGEALAAGDFDHDGDDEIVVAAPAMSAGGFTGAGRVDVYAWDAGSQIFVLHRTLYQGLDLIGETPEVNDGFGSALAVGDFNGDNYDDLAVGVPSEDLGTTGTNQGVVQVFYGFSTGLLFAGSQVWSQESTGVLGSAATGDRFGYSLAAGDFDRDGRDDLAIGVPGEASANVPGSGAVAVLYGMANLGLAAGGNQLWWEGDSGVPGSPVLNDNFGISLAAGDFDLSGRSDLAIGSSAEIAGVTHAGSVTVLQGAAAGLSATGSQILVPTSVGQPLHANGNWGYRLAVGDFDASRHVDLAIGSPLETVTGLTAAGTVDVLQGSSNGLQTSVRTHWVATGLASGPAEQSAFFGWGLCAVDLDGDRDQELVVGIPLRTVDAVSQVGQVQILNGDSTILSDDLEAGSFFGWSAALP